MKRKNEVLTLLVLILLCLSQTVFSADQVFFYHTDPAGTPLAMTNASGQVVWKADYKPFGEENTVTANPKNNKEFVGKEKDEETGLYYFGARYLEPKIGRFTAVDPVRAVDPLTNATKEEHLLNPQRLNTYTYALNNPYRFVDMDGKDIAIQIGLPQGKNRFGHIAAAVTGQGVFSSGTVEPFGSSFTDYLKNQSKYRDSIVYVIPTTKEQDEAFVTAFMKAAQKGHSASKNNCADMIGKGLQATGLIGPNAALKLPGMINSYMIRRATEGVVSSVIMIDEGNQQWGQLDRLFGQFNPKKAEK
jgi:RHS repeat-associated protein